MLKKLPFLAALVLWASSSYSESIAPYYGTTGNAAAGGNTWSMDNHLPSNIPGLDINGVIYRYTINKNVDDSVSVTIQNERANGTGYQFRETDDWLPGSLGGTQINKAVPVIPSNRSLWGDGSIQVDGNGNVEEPHVVYQYRVDPCYDPQFDPNCPGYKVPVPEIPTVDLTSLYDVTTDENIDLDRNVDKELLEEDSDENEKTEEELAEEEEEEEKDREQRLEDSLAEAGRSIMFAQALAQSQILASVNAATNMNSYYTVSIPGGVYKESVVLVDKELPNSKRGLRNGLAQQLLHEEMIEMQYNR
jgi:hypothetical protein